jgi:hypothetical protein
MNKLQEFTLSSPQSSTATMRSLADSARRCLGNFLPLAMMEGKKVGMGLIVMFGFGVGAFVLLISGSLTMLGCLVAGFVENNMLSWTWSLLSVALLNFVSACGLLFLAIKCSKDLLFYATRRQLCLQSSSVPSYD